MFSNSKRLIILYLTYSLTYLTYSLTLFIVIPVQAGIQRNRENPLRLDSCLRRNDGLENKSNKYNH